MNYSAGFYPRQLFILMIPKPTRGGKRAGAGCKRKPEEQRTITRSINLTRDQWAKLDQSRGGLSRSKWIALLLGWAA